MSWGVDNAVSVLQEHHAAGETVHMLCSKGDIITFGPQDVFQATVITTSGPRKAVIEWLDEHTLAAGLWRQAGWIGIIAVDHEGFAEAGRLGVFVGWYRDEMDPLIGPVMNFGAAFLNIERRYKRWLAVAVENELMWEHGIELPGKQIYDDE